MKTSSNYTHILCVLLIIFGAKRNSASNNCVGDNAPFPISLYHTYKLIIENSMCEASKHHFKLKFLTLIVCGLPETLLLSLFPCKDIKKQLLTELLPVVKSHDE